MNDKVYIQQKDGTTKEFDSFDEMVNDWNANESLWDKFCRFFRIKWDKLIRIPNKIKWAFQRAKRGYSDCDIWGLDGYLIDILINGISQLKNNLCGYPASMNSIKEWEEVLDKMIDGFKLSQTLINNDCYFDIPKDRGKELSDIIKKYDIKVFTKEDRELHDNAFKLLAKHFYDLWD